MPTTPGNQFIKRPDSLLEIISSLYTKKLPRESSTAEPNSGKKKSLLKKTDWTG